LNEPVKAVFRELATRRYGEPIRRPDARSVAVSVPPAGVGSGVAVGSRVAVGSAVGRGGKVILGVAAAGAGCVVTPGAADDPQAAAREAMHTTAAPSRNPCGRDRSVTAQP